MEFLGPSILKLAKIQTNEPKKKTARDVNDFWLMLYMKAGNGYNDLICLESFANEDLKYF